MNLLLVILDLDETLIHVPDRPFARAPDFLAVGYSVYKRPHVDQLLAGLLAKYQVAIWTASGRTYAEAVVAQLLGDPARLEFLWCAERCTERFNHETRDRSTVKSLKKVRRRGYDLERILFVDDSPEKHVLNYGNLIHVRPFEGDLDDAELPSLAAYIGTRRRAEHEDDREAPLARRDGRASRRGYRRSRRAPSPSMKGG